MKLWQQRSDATLAHPMEGVPVRHGVRPLSSTARVTPTTLASASGQSEPWAIAVDATSVYWTEDGNVMKVAK